MISTDPFAHIAPLDNRRAWARDQVERLVTLARYLAPSDRWLIERVYQDGLPASRVASDFGASPRYVQRRLQRLLGRLNDALFQFAVARLDDLPRDHRLVAEASILHGRSLRETARRTRLSLHQVRQCLDHIREVASAA